MKTAFHGLIIFMLGVFLSACAETNDLTNLPDSVETIVAHVDISDQRMIIELDSVERFAWEVSTAREGKETPRGTYGAYWLSRDHYSSLYDGAPMPFAIFFDGDYAIHGTELESELGSPASAGCVRLSRKTPKYCSTWSKSTGSRVSVLPLLTKTTTRNARLDLVSRVNA